jgi:streptogramin lyase
MKKLLLLLPVYLCCLGLVLHAQTVSTFVTNSGLNGPAGLALDSAQNLYVANYAGGNGMGILKVNPSAQVTVADSFATSAMGLCIDLYQNMFVTNVHDGYITKTDASGTKSIVYYHPGSHPTNLAFDASGNMFVSDNSGALYKMAPDGTLSNFSSDLSGPQGLSFDATGKLFVANYLNGQICKITPAGSLSVFATVPDPLTAHLTHLAISASGSLYVSAFSHNKIYKISTDGSVSVLAGTGMAGGTNGPASQATFDGPNGIVFTPQGDLIVSEYNANRIRLIQDVENTASAPWLSKQSQATIKVHLTEPITLSIHQAEPASHLLKVFTLAGEEVVAFTNKQSTAQNPVYTLHKNKLAAGMYIAVLYSDNTILARQKFCIP